MMKFIAMCLVVFILSAIGTPCYASRSIFLIPGTKTLVLPGLNITNPQQLSLSLSFFQKLSNSGFSNALGIEPGLTGHKAYLLRLKTYGGAGPISWNYKLGGLYMTKDAFGLSKDQAYLGVEIGGWAIGVSGSIGMYRRVSGRKNGFPSILSASIGIGWR